MSSRVAAVAEVLLCSSIPTQIAIGAVLRLAGMPVTDASGQLSFAYVLTLSIADMVLLIALMMTFLRLHGQRPSQLWLGTRPVGREVAIGLLLVPVTFAIVVLVLGVLRWSMPWLHNVDTNPLEQLAQTPGNAAVFGAVAVLAGGVREELQRAFLLDRFERHLGGAFVGLVVVSIGFGLGHALQGWDAVIATGTLGAFWAGIFLRRRSSIAPVVSHAGFNALEVLRAALSSA